MNYYFTVLLKCRIKILTTQKTGNIIAYVICLKFVH